MAILQNRMSTTVVPDDYFPPDDVLYGAMISYEAGPIALNDPSEGQKYQDWVLTYADPLFTLTPQTTGSPVVLPISVPEVIKLGLAFDQNGHEAICYNTLTNGYLYWWDSSIPGFTTSDFGSARSLALQLDDKRSRQTQVNDIILWYTKAGVSNYDLFNRIQRERFEEETLMANNVSEHIAQVGMHVGYRGQVTLASRHVIPPIVPPGPPVPQANLDFELGDVYWEKTGDFDIVQTDPYAGSWSAILNTINYSTLENSVYTAILATSISVSCYAKGSIATDIKIGFKFYNAAKSLISTYTVIRNITTNWTQIAYSLPVPISAVYARIFVESNATDGIVSLDNFDFTTLSYYIVDLATTVYYSIELDTPTSFEIEL